jgi:hypothetical protein
LEKLSLIHNHLLLFLLFLINQNYSQITNEHWSERFCKTGTSGNVHSIVKIGNEIYAGGEFEFAGGTQVYCIASWNGRSWKTLAGGVSGQFVGTPGSYVYSLAVLGNDLYAGGSFISAGGVTVNGVARWNGTNWSAIGPPSSPGVDNIVQVLEVHNGQLYIGGHFTTAGGVQCNGVAKYNPSTNTFSPFGTGCIGGVRAFAFDSIYVYVGGSIYEAGGLDYVQNIAVYDTLNNVWSRLGGGYYSNGVNGSVTSIIIHQDTLFLGGTFTGGYRMNGTFQQSSYFIKWFLGEWLPFGNGFNGPVSCIKNIGDDFYIGGSFSSANNVTAYKLCKWNVRNYSVTTIGDIDIDFPGLGTVFTILIDSPKIHIGGNYTAVNDGWHFNISRLDLTNSRWNGFGEGLEHNCFAIGITADGKHEPYAGGYFSQAGGVSVNKIAHWSSNRWQKLNTGVDGFGRVYSLASVYNYIYLGGDFNSVNSITCNGIARWHKNTETWTALGSGFSGGGYRQVNAILALGDSNIYAGGDFTTSGGTTVNYIAKWNGTSWQALGTGVDGIVRAIAYCNGVVYVGGDFTTAGGVTANYISKWDGTSWQPIVVSGVNGVEYTVYSLAVNGNDLYVGGDFFTAGNISANHVAKYSTVTNTWTALGNGTSGNPYSGVVYAMTYYNNNLYVGGAFTQAGTVEANFCARWNGSSWEALGSGTNNIVYTMASDGQGNIFVGGLFTTAGNLSSYRFAQLSTSTPLPVELSSFSAYKLENSIRLSWNTQTEVNNFGFEVERKIEGSNAHSHWQKLGFIQGNGNSNIQRSYNFVDDLKNTKEKLKNMIYYRLKQLNNDGSFTYSNEIFITLHPVSSTLLQNYPNPFNPSTRIQYSVDKNQRITIKVYDVIGNEIAKLVDEIQQPGIYTITLDGNKLPTGTYFYTLITEDKTTSKKMILLK